MTIIKYGMQFDVCGVELHPYPDLPIPPPPVSPADAKPCAPSYHSFLLEPYSHRAVVPHVDQGKTREVVVDCTNGCLDNHPCLQD